MDDPVILLLEVILILILLLQAWLLHFWAKEHAVIMSIISHSLVEIKKKLGN